MEALDLGVPDIPSPGDPYLGNAGSELWRRRLRLKIPPRLLRPVVEVEFRPDCWPGGCKGGVGSAASSRTFVSEPIVEDLPRLPNGIGGLRAGDEAVDCADTVESVRSIGLPGPANFNDETASAECDGDGNGDGAPYIVWPLGKGRGCGESSGVPTAEDRMGDADVLALVDAREAVADRAEGSGGGILTGRGNRGPLFFFLCGRRKNVVVVEIVCVVVVEA